MSISAEKIKELAVFFDMTVKSAMKTLCSIDSKVLFVVDSNNRLVGSVTDGDIRRAILSGSGFETPVREIMFKSPRFIKHGEKDFEKKVKQYVIEEKLYAIPVLDGKESIVDILFWHDFFDYHPLDEHSDKVFSNPVVIMAGGEGSRLDPFTKILPKPLIPFGDKPILEKIMDNFSKYMFRNFILTLNYKKEMIKMYLKENTLPYNVEWTEESKNLGTAGSLSLLKDKLKETFFVCNCDTLLDTDFKDILLWHREEKALLTLVGCHKELIFPYGVLDIHNGSLKSINEKPTFDLIINTGLYVMEPDILKLMPHEEPFDMDKLVQKTVKIGKVAVFPTYGKWFDIGQWKEYRESLYLLRDVKEKES